MANKYTKRGRLRLVDTTHSQEKGYMDGHRIAYADDYKGKMTLRTFCKVTITLPVENLRDKETEARLDMAYSCRNCMRELGRLKMLSIEDPVAHDREMKKLHTEGCGWDVATESKP